MSVEAIRAALRADNEARFDPPLDDSEIESILKQVAKWAPGGTIDPEHRTDFGNARRLVTQYGQDLRYSQTHGWFTWTGQRWQQDELRRRGAVGEGRGASDLYRGGRLRR